MIISSCSSSEYAVNESRPRKNQKPSDHAVLFEFENAIGDNLEYWIEYLGNDTFLSCLHRFSVTEPDGSVFEHVFTVLGETRLPNIDSNRLEVLGWLSTIPSVRVGRDTFDIYVLQGYDTVGKHRSVHRKELIPAISSDYGTEYVEAEYFDKSRKILKISTDTGLTHIRFTNPERKMLTMYLVMLDLKRMLALDSVECKWLPIETVEFGQTLNE
mgnify:CR=1 FL=1